MNWARRSIPAPAPAPPPPRIIVYLVNISLGVEISLLIQRLARGTTVQGSNSKSDTRDFLFSKTVQTGSGALRTSHSMGTGILPGGRVAENFKLTSYLHVVPRFRVSGAISLLPLYVFMESTWTTLPLL